jgi:hypothetical protein
MKKLSAVLFASALSLPISVYAASDTNRTLTSVGVQGTFAYLTVTPAFSLSCLYGVAYVDLSTSYGKYLYAQIISAYSAGLPTKRIDYTNAGDNTRCNISLVNF